MAQQIRDEQTYKPELSAEDLPRKMIPELRGISVGPGIEKLGEALQGKVEADAQTYAGNQLADLRLSMMDNMEKAKQNAKPGADGYTSDVLKQFDTLSKQYQPNTGMNPYVSRAMQPGLQRMREQFGQQAMEYEAQAGVAYRGQSAKDTVDKLATIAAQHPDQAAELTGQALTQVNSSRLGPDVTLNVAKYAQSTISKSAVLTRINQDPYSTMNALMNPEKADVTIQGLTPEERETLLTHADAMLHQRVSDAERLTSMQEKQERYNASATLTGLIEKSQGPQGLTMSDVMKVAPVFRHEPQGLEAAMNLASGKTAESDPHVYADLFSRAARGEDVTQEATGHLARDLSKEDWTRVASMSDKGIPSAAKEGVNTIDGVFKQGVFDKYDLDFNTRHVNALNDYYTWTRANPNATPDQSATQAMTIAKSYAQSALISFSQTAPLPRFAVGNRATLNPDATWAATKAAEQAGRISHADALQQAGLIAQWKSAMERAQAKAQQ